MPHPRPLAVGPAEADCPVRRTGVADPPARTDRSRHVRIEVFEVRAVGVLAPGGKARRIRTQLNRILETAGLPNVILQVLPFDMGVHASMGTSFELLQFPEAGDTAIIYIEDHTSSQYLETAADIDRYTLVFDHLRASALSPERSAEFIDQVASSMT
jgi:hypothetical protein